AQAGAAALYGQAAEQLRARRPQSPRAARRAPHRRAPRPHRLRVFAVPPAVRARAALQPFPRAHPPPLRRLRAPDGPLGCRPARPRLPPVLRRAGGGHRGGSPAVARCVRAAVRPGLPPVLRERTGGGDRELRAGAATRLPRRPRSLAAFRALASAPRGGPRGRGCPLPAVHFVVI